MYKKLSLYRRIIYAAPCVMLAAQGCQGPFLIHFSRLKTRSVKNMNAPKPKHLGEPPDDAPYAYKKGWNDGCKSGLSVSDPGAYKAFYTMTVDPDLYKVRMYYQVWNDAYKYCRQYQTTWSWISLDETFQKDNLCIICPQK